MVGSPQVTPILGIKIKIQNRKFTTFSLQKKVAPMGATWGLPGGTYLPVHPVYTQKVNTEDRYYYIYVISSKSKGKTAYDCEKFSKS